MAGIAVGCKGRSELVVTREDSAKMMGSGALMVFSTPSMVALMENAACNALEPCAGGIGQCGRSDERAAHLGDPRRHAGVR